MKTRGFGGALCALLLVVGACVPGCDDPVPGPIGGVLLVVRCFEAEAPSRFEEIAAIELRYERIEGIVRAPSGETARYVLDAADRVVLLPNADQDVLVAQLQVPVGELEQLRIFPSSVVLHLRSGAAVVLDPETADLPSWSHTGLKIVPDEATPVVVEGDRLTGVRALLHFDDRLVRNGPRAQTARGWKLKPTWPAEPFEPNPAADEPGVFVDELNVVFERDVSSARASEIVAGLGATVLREPILSTWYRVRLPVTQNLETAVAYFDGFPGEVVTAIPAVNLALRDHATPLEGVDPNQSLVGLPEAWHLAAERDPSGLVGSAHVRVAIIDSYVDVTNPDLRRNIWINQGELPAELFDANNDGDITPGEIEPWDCDPPGAPDLLITFYDLDCAPPGTIQPVDVNDNGLIDAEDLVNDTDWADAVDDDDNDLFDDLVGWDFSWEPDDRFNRGRHVFRSSYSPSYTRHGTEVASVVGAEASNGAGGTAGLGVAGTVHRVSIVPLVASAGSSLTMPSEELAEAIRYAERQDFDVVNISAGYTFLRAGASTGCGDGSEAIPKIPEDVFAAGRAAAISGYRSLFLAPSRSLYVLATGNNGYDLDQSGIFDLPWGALSAIPEVAPGVVHVGGGLDEQNKAPFSSYGSGDAIDLYAPSVNWRVASTGGCQCQTIACRDEGGALLDVCVNDPSLECPFEPRARFCVISGTSVAAPAVAGAAALLLTGTARLRGDPAAVRDALLNSARTVSGYAVCGGETFGGRVLDVGALLSAEAP